MALNEPKLGAKYRDSITGFTGVAVAYGHYLHGCSQVLLQPECQSGDWDLPKSQWLDYPRLVLIELGATIPKGPMQPTVVAQGSSQ